MQSWSNRRTAYRDGNRARILFWSQKTWYTARSDTAGRVSVPRGYYTVLSCGWRRLLLLQSVGQQQSAAWLYNRWCGNLAGRRRRFISVPHVVGDDYRLRSTVRDDETCVQRRQWLVVDTPQKAGPSGQTDGLTDGHQNAFIIDVANVITHRRRSWQNSCMNLC